MGSPVSAIVAMEFFKELALRSALVKPRLWKWYVDNACCILKKGVAEGLLDHLNSIWQTNKFTIELEKNGTLPFLDTHLRRKEDSNLAIMVCRKPTHTDWYLHFRFHHLSHVKRGPVRCLHDRARGITVSHRRRKTT